MLQFADRRLLLISFIFIILSLASMHRIISAAAPRPILFPRGGDVATPRRFALEIMLSPSDDERRGAAPPRARRHSLRAAAGEMLSYYFRHFADYYDE